MKTDPEHKDAIGKAIAELRRLITEARHDGLAVELQLRDERYYHVLPSSPWPDTEPQVILYRLSRQV